jgi:hypothetical protein
MMPGQKKEREIKPILGNIPAFLNYPINFYFSVDALSARSRLPSSNTASDVDAYRLDWRLLNPALRVSNLKYVLGP